MTTDDGATFEVIMDPNPPSGWETQPDGIGVLKSNTGLRDAIQKALQALMDDGTYKTIIEPLRHPAARQGHHQRRYATRRLIDKRRGT